MTGLHQIASENLKNAILMKLSNPSDPILSLIIERITSTLIVEQIFSYPFRLHRKTIRQLYVVLRKGAGQGILDSRAICNFVLEDRPGYHCLVVFPDDINQKIKLGNIRTMLICHPDHSVYQHPDGVSKIILPEINYSNWIEQAKSYFGKEIAKITTFEEGYRFYLNRSD